MASKLQCEICGGKLIGKPGGIFECENCGTEYSTEWAKAKIQEITGTVKVEGTVEVTGKVQIDGPVKVEGGANKEALLQRGMMALEDQNWERAKELFNQVLNYDATCAEAFLGLTMADSYRKSREDFLNDLTDPNSKLSVVLEDPSSRLKEAKKNLERARKYADADLKEWFSKVDSAQQVRDKACEEAAIMELNDLKELLVTERTDLTKRQSTLKDEHAMLASEHSSLKGLFSGKRRKEIETRLAELDFTYKENEDRLKEIEAGLAGIELDLKKLG